jgi:hypothetical protein
MRFRTLLIGAATAALVGIGVLAAPGANASTTMVTSQPGTHLTSGCWYHPYNVTAALDANVYHWDLDLYVVNPAGQVTDFEYEYGYTTTTGYQVNASLSAFLCSYIDGPGTYQIGGVLETTDRNWNPLPDVTVSGTFTSTLPVVTPPPPPPPAPVPTPATPPANASAAKGEDRIRVVMTTGSIPANTVANATTWRIRVDGQQATTVRQLANDRDTWTKRFRDHSGTHKVVITKNGWFFDSYKVNTNS